MDRHLNLFRTFSQNEDKQHLEDNLSRALVLCLKNNALFYQSFLKTILNKTDYDYLFSHYNDNDRIEIDIQRRATELDGASFKKVYGIGLTSTDLDCANFFNNYQYSSNDAYQPETDISIIINDILIIIEVKRHAEDCRQQLYNQIWQLFPVTKNDEKTIPTENIEVQSIKWQDVMALVFKTNNFHRMIGQSSQFLSDFITLIQGYCPSWIPMQPLSNIGPDASNDHLRWLRLSTAIKSSKKANVALDFNDRIGLDLKEPWVNELLFSFSKDEKGVPVLNINMYPGNTKNQGWHLYNAENLNWRNKSHINIAGVEAKLSYYCHIKFTSFQSYFTGLDFGPSKLKPGKSICEPKNFNISGRKKRENWDQLAAFFDDHFIESYNWRKVCQWDKKIIESGKNQFDISFGYCVYVKIPYSNLREIDNTLDTESGLSDFICQAYQEFKNVNKVLVLEEQ